MVDEIGLVGAFNAIKRRYDSSIKSINEMANHIQSLQAIITKQELQMKQIIKGNTTKQKIINSAIDIANETSNKYLEEINELRKEIKCLSQ